MNDDIIVFGEDWSGLPSSTQHLIRHLSNNRKTIWVNSIGLRHPRLSKYDLKRVWIKVKALVNHLPRSATDTPFPVVAPRAIPWPGNSVARLINRRLLANQVRSVATAEGISKPILWISLPTAVVVAGALEEKGLIYYCGDDFGALAGVDHNPVLKLEHELVNKADIILAASPKLANRFPKEKTHLLPHGVDLDLFTTPIQKAPELPEKTPVAGFYGSIAEWLDFKLIAGAASQLPHWQFVLIGDIKADISILKTIPNISFLGSRAHHTLPSYSQHWQASLLPFKNNAQIRASNPLKLREYLAAGSAIISTDFPALNQYRDLVHVIHDHVELARALESSLKEDSTMRRKRQKRVENESWAARANDINKLMKKYF